MGTLADTLTSKFRGQDALGMDMFRRINYAVQSWFQGKRNYYDVFGYTVNPTFDHRMAKYLRQDVAARIVDAPALAMWTNPPQVTSTSDGWNLLWDDLIARYNLWSAIERGDKLAGIGRFSLLLLGFNDGRDLSLPVNTRAITQKDPKILYIQPYSERCVKVKGFNTNAMDENFNKPELYTIFPQNEFVLAFNNASLNRKDNLNGAFDVHASRVIHMAENCLENSVYGSPRMERVYNVLDDLLKVVGGAAETFWLTGNRGLHIDIDKEMEIDTGDEAALSAEMDEYQHQQRRIIRTRGAKVTAIGSDNPDPTGAFNMLINMLSGATGIPKRILTGAEAGQLASEQDRANWADRIDERRASWGNPWVIFPIIKKLVAAGYFPREEEIEVTVDWPTSFKMSPLENAQTSAQHARSATNFAKAIETMENMKRGTPATPAMPGKPGPDGAPGIEIPGDPGVPGLDLGDLVTVDEARKMIGLDKPAVTFDSGEDIAAPSSGPPSAQRVHDRRVKISVGRIMHF